MRLFTASLATETNTFSPIPTSLESFKGTMYYPPGTHPAEPTLCTGPLWVGRRRAKEEGWTLVEGSSFWAEPSGTVARAAYEEMRDEILGQLRAALPVDGVILGLHGAMVAHGYDDCEGDLLERVRALVGPKVPVGAEYDPHSHLTRKRVANADVSVCFKEFPHTDFVERAEEMVDIVIRAVKGEVRPVTSVFDCRMIGSFPTTIQPMRGFVDRIKGLEGRDGVLSISVVHCFPYADVPEIGAKIVVVTDDRKDAGDKLAAELGREFVTMRGKTLPAYHTIDGAIDKALAAARGPVVIADPSDNAGGGAPSDSTPILHRLLARKVESAALGPIWDPVAVRFCFDAGEGARFPLRFGGKTAVTSGAPVDAQVEVLKLMRDNFQTFGRAKVPLGDCAAIRAGGVDVVLISSRTQALGTDLFTNLGVDLAQKRIVVVKSTNHFHAAFSKVASEILYCDSDGPIPRDHRKVPYTRVQRPIWPLDEVAEPAFAV
jgi:microcystin degradation protein MlrC